MSVFDATPTVNTNSVAGLQAGDRFVVLVTSGISDGTESISTANGNKFLDQTRMGDLGSKQLGITHRVYWYENR